jgi:Family of unknown function (DUF6503)
MKRLKLIIFIPFAMFISCTDAPNNTQEAEVSQAQEIVNRAIDAIGGGMLENAEVTFKFRTRDYIFWQKGGQYKYTRIFVDTSGSKSVDILTNDGLTRTIDGKPVKLDDLWTQRYSNSVNSVFYFAFLPYRLNDAAVIKTYNGLKDFNGKNYHEIEVQFAKEGGGVDHDDNFLYWFSEDKYALDYFAYDYVTGKGGVRFRQAINRRLVNGLIVQDYVNYKPGDKKTNLYGMFEAHKRGELIELSRIELENVVVKKLSSE